MRMKISLLETRHKRQIHSFDGDRHNYSMSQHLSSAVIIRWVSYFVCPLQGAGDAPG